MRLTKKWEALYLNVYLKTEGGNSTGSTTERGRGKKTYYYCYYYYSYYYYYSIYCDYYVVINIKHAIGEKEMRLTKKW